MQLHHVGLGDGSHDTLPERWAWRNAQGKQRCMFYTAKDIFGIESAVPNGEPSNVSLSERISAQRLNHTSALA